MKRRIIKRDESKATQDKIQSYLYKSKQNIKKWNEIEQPELRREEPDYRLQGSMKRNGLKQYKMRQH